MDLTVEAEAFGSSIAFPENDMPHILGSLVDSESIEGLQIPSLSSGRIPEYIPVSYTHLLYDILLVIFMLLIINDEQDEGNGFVNR